jgi:putative protease
MGKSVMIEIVSPAGTPEAVIAAVQNGADAVYLGFKKYNSSIGAKNFTRNELGRSLEYCRVRGVKTYLTLNNLVYNSELSSVSEYAKEAARLGIDAIIVSDFGVMRVVRKSVPGIPIHADQRMGIHNLEGVKIAAAMGFSRVILAAELSHNKLAYICRNSPIEIEIQVHGEMCVAYPDQCYFSALQDTGSNSRGKCAMPCRDIYNAVGHTARNPLSIKDNCLAAHINSLSKIGVTAVNIAGRDKRPEYSAIITEIYAKAVHSEKLPTLEELSVANKLLTRYGLTDGYYKNKIGSGMFGVSKEKDKPESVVYSTARRNYLNGEYQRVPIKYNGTISKGKRIKLAGSDDRNNNAIVYGPIPVPAFHKDLNDAALRTQLHKTSGTPFYCEDVKSIVEPGLSLPISAFDELRSDLLAEILEQRRLRPVREEGEYIPPKYIEGYSEPKAITVYLMRLEQLSQELIDLQPNIIYIPINNINYDDALMSSLLNNKKVKTCAALPHIIHDNEKKSMSNLLLKAIKFGIKDALIGNIGQIHLVRSHGMTVRGDYSLNAFNSESVFVLRDLGFKSITLSYELSFNELKQLSKPISTELIVYGRFPLMLTENCIVRNSTGTCTCDSYPCLVDKDGSHFPIMSEYGCRNLLLSPRKLYLADKRKALKSTGARAKRLNFTTENATECVSILKRYMGLGNHTPSSFTRGLYYRGVDN